MEGFLHHDFRRGLIFGGAYFRNFTVVLISRVSCSLTGNVCFFFLGLEQ